MLYVFILVTLCINKKLKKKKYIVFITSVDTVSILKIASNSLSYFRTQNMSYIAYSCFSSSNSNKINPKEYTSGGFVNWALKEELENRRQTKDSRSFGYITGNPISQNITHFGSCNSGVPTI